MQLKDVVEETLKEIIDGHVDAQRYYAEKGRSVAFGIGQVNGVRPLLHSLRYAIFRSWRVLFDWNFPEPSTT